MNKRLKAQEAKRLSENELLTEALNIMRENMIAEMIKAPYDDTTVRNECKCTIKVIDNFTRYLVMAINEGKIEVKYE